MMDRLFNSVFENSLRLLILLDEYDLPQTLDMLYVVDFMSLYSKAFGLGDKNLNGENTYKFSEFASQRGLVNAALKGLVLNGTAEAVRYKDGLSYIITPEGEDYCNSLESEYACEYRANAKAVIEAVGDKSERDLISTIYGLSKSAFREGVIQ